MISTAVLCSSPSAIAAEKIVLKYKVFRQSISVQELTTFAETGQLSPALEHYLKAGKQNPEEVRRVLNQPVDINLITLDRVLNFYPLGELFLDQVSQTVHPPNKEASRQALRAALILSASPDNKVTLIEILQKYPTSEVQVEGDRLVQAYGQINEISKLTRRIAEL
jgi:hypothetical protein